jgi:hypothetical protein
VIVVEGGAFFETEIVPIAVVAIVLEDAHLRIAKGVDDAPDDGRLP